MSSAYVGIKFKKKLFHFVTHNGMLETNYLKNYFPDATKLIYFKDGKKFSLVIKRSQLKMIFGVSEYEVVNKQGK